MERNWRWRAVWITKSVITVTLLAWVIQLAEPRALAGAFAKLNAVAVVGALAALLVAYLIAFFRWGILLRCVGFSAPLRSVVPEYLISLFYNHVLPSSVGGDAVRVYYLQRRGFDLHDLVASTVTDRLLGLFSVAAMSALMWVWVADDFGAGAPTRFAPVMLVSLGALLLAALWFRLRGRIRRMLSSLGSGRTQQLLRRLIQALESYKKARGSLAVAFVLSILSQSAVVLAYISLASALGINLPWQDYFFLVPSVMLLQILPVSFAGLGVREAGLVGLLSLLGIDIEQAVALSLSYLAVFWLSVTPGAVLAVRYFLINPKVGADERGA